MGWNKSPEVCVKFNYLFVFVSNFILRKIKYTQAIGERVTSHFIFYYLNYRGSIDCA